MSDATERQRGSGEANPLIPMSDAPEAGSRLVAEATNKSGLVWIRPAESGRATPAWHCWIEGAAYVVGGGAEQPIPALVDAAHAEITVPSKDTGARVVTWVAQVTQVAPGSDEWQRVVPVLAAKRLNAVDSPSQPQRWAEHSALFRLVPTGELTQAPGAMPSGSGAAPPPVSPATTNGRLPFVLGRSRRRNG